MLYVPSPVSSSKGNIRGVSKFSKMLRQEGKQENVKVEKIQNNLTAIGTEKNISREESNSVKPEKISRDKVVIGILSHSNNVCLRNAQRRTTIPLARNYTKLDIQFVFVLDSATPALMTEQKANNDMVFLNITEGGWNHLFTLKLYLWYKYAVHHYPDLLLVGRMDDDLFLCIPQALDRLASIKHKNLYYGYGVVCRNDECLDDVYLFFGIELAKRIVNQTHCSVKSVKGCLADGKHPGTAINNWVRTHMKENYVLVNEFKSGKFVYFYLENSLKKKQNLQSLRTENFCQKYILYHKASAKDIYEMHRNNSALSINDVMQAIPQSEIENAEKCSRY